MNDTVTGKHVETFLENEGPKGQRVLKYLQENGETKKALESAIGQVILGEIASSMDKTLNKIINSEATAEELADFRADKRLADKISHTISSYYREQQKVLDGRM